MPDTAGTCSPARGRGGRRWRPRWQPSSGATPEAARARRVGHRVQGMASPGSRFSEAADVVRVLARAGILRPENPVSFLRAGAAARRWSRGLAGGVAANAVRHPRGIAIIDELGPLT